MCSMCLAACTYVHVRVEDRGWCQVAFLISLLGIFWNMGESLNLLATLAVHEAAGSLLSPPFSTSIVDVSHCSSGAPGFQMYANLILKTKAIGMCQTSHWGPVLEVCAHPYPEHQSCRWVPTLIPSTQVSNVSHPCPTFYMMLTIKLISSCFYGKHFTDRTIFSVTQASILHIHFI